MHTSVINNQATKAGLKYLSCFRGTEIIALSGPPLLGAVLAIHHLTAEKAGRLSLLIVANVCLLAHIFLINDWSGLTTDLADPNKVDRVFTSRGVSRNELAGIMFVLLMLSLALFSCLGEISLCLAVAIAILSALYSLPRFNWKGRPLLNSATHIIGGALHFLLGYSVAHVIDERGFAIAVFAALTFAAGHLTQELRDFQGDERNGIRTNAVIFGQRRTFIASLILFTVSHALLFVFALRGILPQPIAVLVVLYPVQLHWSLKTFSSGLTYASICRLQTCYRSLYAIIGVVLVVVLWL